MLRGSESLAAPGMAAATHRRTRRAARIAVSSTGLHATLGLRIRRSLGSLHQLRRVRWSAGDDVGDEPGRRYSDLAICRRLLGHGRQFWPHLVGVFFLALVAMPLALLAPVPLKIGVDSFVDNEPLSGPVAAIAPPGVTSSETGLLVFVALLVVAIGLATEVQRLASSLLGTYTGERMELEFRAELFRHAQRTSLSYHDERGTTDSLYRIFNDGSSIQWIGVYGIAPLATAVFTVGGMIIVTMAIDAKLAIIALAVAPVLFLLTLLYRRRLRSGWIDVKERETESLSVIQETLGALRLVKAFRREDHEHERFRSHSRSRLSAHVRVLFVEGSLRLLVGLFVAIGTAAVLYVGLHDVKAGVLTLGDFLLVMGYLAQLYNPLQSMSQSAAALQASIASADRAFALLDQDVEVQERPDARPLERATGAVAFRQVRWWVSLEQRARGRARLRACSEGSTTPWWVRSCSTGTTFATTASRISAANSRLCSKKAFCSRPRSLRTSRTPDPVRPTTPSMK